MKVLDLFSGIGGFSLGLERAGMETVAFCEIEPYCRQVLAKHWPEVLIYEDIKQLTGARLRKDGITADLICGGFPCQDTSYAGKGAGLQGERSGLWWEMARVVRELAPRWVLVENVPGLLSRGFDNVLGTLASLGYDAEWYCIPACAIGANHQRDRVWIVAHTQEQPERTGLCAGCKIGIGRGRFGDCGGAGDVSDPRCPLFQDGAPGERNRRRRDVIWDTGKQDWWAVEPDVGRVAYGVSHRVDRLRALGNAVVPQVVEVIGRAIMEAEGLDRGSWDNGEDFD